MTRDMTDMSRSRTFFGAIWTQGFFCLAEPLRGTIWQKIIFWGTCGNYIEIYLSQIYLR